jgi:hypothetical protein
VAYFLHILVISAMFCLGGLIFSIKFWSNALVWFNFIVLVVNGFTIGMLAYCITAMVHNKNLGMSIIYGFVLYSFIMQWLFSGGYLLEVLYMDTVNYFIKLFKFIFNLYPSFHFAMIFAAVNRIADNHFDILENRYINERPFTYDDLFERRS